MKRSSRKNRSVDDKSPPKKIPRVSSVNSDARAQGRTAENVPLENRPGCEETCKFTAVALSNFLILKSIFNNLNDEDLDACLQVSPLWKSVGEPLVVPHYDIHLENDRARNYYTNNREGVYSANQVVIKQRTYSSNEENSTKECTYNFHNSAEKLTEITQAGKVAFSLAVVRYGDFEFGTLCNVLPTFGKVVNLYARSCRMGVGSFCRQILEDFPNLRYLRFSDGYLLEDGYNQDFGPLLPQNQLLHLRKIDLTDLKCTTSCLVRVLRTAPNLEEIHNLPLFLTQSLVETQKGSLLKSFCNKSMYSSDETSNSALEKLAQLGPKLSFFSFELDEWGEISLEDSKPRLLQILRSSCDSLRSLTVVPSLSLGFQGIPPFTSLKQIKIDLEAHIWESVVPRIFPIEVVLLQQFPNVTEIDIHLPQNKYMKDYFHENVLSPWGSQIQKLKICLADEDTIGLMGQVFPSVNCFGFEIVELPDNLYSTLEAISEAWPELESLHIKIDEEYIRYGDCRSIKIRIGEQTSCCRRLPMETGQSTRIHDTYKPLRSLSLDSALTGIRDDCLVRLKKDSLLPTNLSTEEIRKLEEESTIRKLKKLKILKFDFTDDNAAAKALSTLTLLSHEFGFRFLPELKVVVRTPQEMKILEGIKKTFQHLNVLKFERKPLTPSSSPESLCWE